MSECCDCTYGCDEYHDLENANARLTRRVIVLEKMVIEMMGEEDKSYRDVKNALIDEWLIEHGLQRRTVL